MAIESERYEFTCRNGATLPNTVVNCSDDGLRLAVSRIQNESSCNCNEPISMKSSSLDLTTETNPAMDSTIDNVQHKTKTKDSTYINIALIMSGIAASITLITAFIVLRKFIETTSRIKHSDLTDTEHNNTINDGYNFIKTIFFDGQMDKKYNNIPPINHMNSIFNCIDVINTLNCNGQMDKEGYKNIPPTSHMTLSSFDNIPYTQYIMVSEKNPTNGQK